MPCAPSVHWFKYTTPICARASKNRLSKDLDLVNNHVESMSAP